MSKKKYSLAERRAYWMGVGISMERHNSERDLSDSKQPKIRKSYIAGYNADNYHDLSKKFL